MTRWTSALTVLLIVPTFAANALPQERAAISGIPGVVAKGEKEGFVFTEWSDPQQRRQDTHR
jgi:hypothetical protein